MEDFKVLSVRKSANTDFLQHAVSAPCRVEKQPDGTFKATVFSGEFEATADSEERAVRALRVIIQEKALKGEL